MPSGQTSAWGIPLALSTVFLASNVVAESADVEANALVGRAQGTTYHIKYWGKGTSSRDEVQKAVDHLLEQFDQQMSTYRDDSEVSRFNRTRRGEWFAVSSETAYLVQQAIEFGLLTDGILDITVAPMLRLWHFGPSSQKGRESLKPPSAEQLKVVQPLIGVEHIRVRREPPALWKDAAKVEIELSSIAPGYAVDLLVERIRGFDFRNVMVELGGEVRAIGVRPDGSPWRIGIERADPGNPGMLRVLPLKDVATSTAGDYKNVLTEDGRQVTHIIDPRTGQALPYRGAAVTVIAETCLATDALDTPLLVMGPKKGYEWCVRRRIAALFQEKNAGDSSVAGPSDGMNVKTTPRFDELVEKLEQSDPPATKTDGK
jgi:thiamine biosynthesis lipoprotein